MKNTKFKSLSAAALAVTLGLTALPMGMVHAEGTTAPETGKIAIIHTNDVHCGVSQTTDKTSGKITGMGYAGVAALKADDAAKYGAGNVTLVDAGDHIQGAPIGSISKGAYLADIMNKVGYDVAVPGNHEFDYGMAQFKAIVDKANYPYLSCNFTNIDGSAVKSASGNKTIEPYKMFDYNGIKVAYVGITTPESFTKSTPAYFQDDNGKYIYSFAEGNNGADLYKAVQKSVDSAKAAGATYVVAVAHLGENGTTDAWKGDAVIKNTDGIDIMIDGHSHEQLQDSNYVNKDGAKVLHVMAGTKLSAVGEVVIDTKNTADKSDDVISSCLYNGTGEKTSDKDTLTYTAYTNQDATVKAYVDDINNSFKADMAKVVGTTAYDLTTNDPDTGKRAVRTADTNLTDLCADANRLALGTSVDVGIINGGGVRATIAKGDITVEKLMTTYPFGNNLCVISASGQTLKDALEMSARLYPQENGGFLHVSGATYTIDPTVNGGKSGVVLNDKNEFVSFDNTKEYRVRNIMIGGKAIDLNKQYTIGGFDYTLINGGDGFTMFKKNGTVVKKNVMGDFEVLKKYISENLKGVVSADYSNAKGQGRISFGETVTPAAGEKVSKDVFTAAKASGKDLMIKSNDGKAAFDFAASKLDTAKIADFDPTVKIGTVGTNAKLAAKYAALKGSDKAKAIELNFAFSGDLPGEAQVTLDLSSAGFADGATVYLYYYNATTDKLEKVTSSVISGGKATFTMTHCSDYVVTDTELKAETTTSTSPKTGTSSTAAAVALLTIIALAGYEIKRTKKVA